MKEIKNVGQDRQLTFKTRALWLMPEDSHPLIGKYDVHNMDYVSLPMFDFYNSTTMNETSYY